MSSHPRWTSVSMPYVTGVPGDAWAAEAAAQGGTGTQRLLEVGEKPAPEPVAAALDLQAGDPVVLRSRLMLLDDQPVERVESYYPASIARGTRLAETRKVPGGAVAHLTTLGYPSRRIVEDVTARLASPDEAEEFGLQPPSCIVQISRVILSDHDLPVEASIMTAPADNRRLRYEITP
ncbi:GntR family transcriptional regulator [Myceligenerans pegani]|uniref:UTRA domain-containing protein n=1 Tax=Myceligenerans pegani TaxID=2776917 RepID=A0ABR9N4X5_9MICO|nr:UTRA domain-containing protein [Myceligenerans sp. TRM 65318]MBE1878705.1 UTRA domain-containing protein [Myceligenerans sp. TRM 65318]MBE3020976.1 UTRA domain-containing protein [Myceligenerans sp. TRM 65318]